MTALDAFKRVYAAVLKEGLKISTADKDLGVITATQDIVYGKGASSPVNIMVEAAQGGGSKVSANYTVAPMMGASAKEIQRILCTFLAAAQP